MTREGMSTAILSKVKTSGNNLPPRTILHGVEGLGKTSFAASAPSPIFMQSRGETGLETLIDSGLVGDVPHFPETQTWRDVEDSLKAILNGEHDYKVLVLDTINGFEQMLYDFVCKRDYGGQWNDKGFLSFMQGYETAQSDWKKFLTLLDQIREERKIWIICLCHTKVGAFRNPEAGDYDRYEPDMHKKTWGLTHKWADMVLFGNFEVVVDERKRKATGAGVRVLYPVRTAAYDAKNRHGLESPIPMGNSGKEAWGNFTKAINNAKKSKNG